MVSKERISHPNCVLGWSSQESFFTVWGTTSTLVFLPFFSSFSFQPVFFMGFFSFHFFLLHFFLGSLSSIFTLLLLTHNSGRGELNNFWNSIFPYICLSALDIWSLIAREEISFCLCPPMWRVILGRDIEENLLGLKRVTMDHFYISERMMKDGHFSFRT